MKIIEQFARNCPCFKNNVNRVDSRYVTFQNRGPLGLMLHSVGCNQPRADVFAKGWDRADNDSAITHAVLQADGTVYQLMPWNYRAWHAGGDANNTHIGVEMTEPSQIHYTAGASFTCSDLEAARTQCRGTYQTAVELFAMLCGTYGLDPMKDIISHNEGGKMGIASGHVDPEHLWDGLGMGYTMDGFRQDVAAKIAEADAPKKTVEEVALEVLRGRWSAGAERKQLLEAAGYDYDEVQAAVKALRAQLEDAPVLDGVETPPAPRYYDEALALAVELGITDGSRPEEPALRCEVVTMLMRLLALIRGETVEK